MAMRSLVALSLVALLQPIQVATAAPSADKCLATKTKIVGTYFACLEKAQAKAILKGTGVDTTKCDDGYRKRWQKIEDSSAGLCLDGVSADAVRSEIAECVSESAKLLNGTAKIPTCGDGTLNVPGELCDRTDLGRSTCQTLGFSGGSLACTADCRLDTSGCTSSSCASSSPGFEPPSGCDCQDTWTYNGLTICNGGCANPDHDPAGPWCMTKATCNGQTFAYCVESSTQPACATGAAGYSPPAGCTCMSSWSYGGQTYCGGQCANPDNDSSGPWCFTTSACNGATWAYCTQ